MEGEGRRIVEGGGRRVMEGEGRRIVEGEEVQRNRQTGGKW